MQTCAVARTFGLPAPKAFQQAFRNGVRAIQGRSKGTVAVSWKV